MVANEIRCAIKVAARTALPKLTALMWRAYGEQRITEAEAEELTNLIELRKVVPSAKGAVRTSVGSSPRTDDSLERRRRWAAAGRLPPSLAARFSQGEVAVLAVVADTVVRFGDCRRCIEQIGALAGVCRSTVKKSIQRAKRLGLLTIEERRQRAWRNLTNIVRIVCPEWDAWNDLARRPFPGGGGVKFVTGPNTISYKGWEKRGFSSSKRQPRRQNRSAEEEPVRDSCAGGQSLGPVNEKSGPFA